MNSLVGCVFVFMVTYFFKLSVAYGGFNSDLMNNTSLNVSDVITKLSEIKLLKCTDSEISLFLDENYTLDRSINLNGKQQTDENDSEISFDSGVLIKSIKGFCDLFKEVREGGRCFLYEDACMGNSLYIDPLLKKCYSSICILSTLFFYVNQKTGVNSSDDESVKTNIDDLPIDHMIVITHLIVTTLCCETIRYKQRKQDFSCNEIQVFHCYDENNWTALGGGDLYQCFLVIKNKIKEKKMKSPLVDWILTWSELSYLDALLNYDNKDFVTDDISCAKNKSEVWQDLMAVTKMFSSEVMSSGECELPQKTAILFRDTISEENLYKINEYVDILKNKIAEFRSRELSSETTSYTDKLVQWLIKPMEQTIKSIMDEFIVCPIYRKENSCSCGGIDQPFERILKNHIDNNINQADYEFFINKVASGDTDCVELGDTKCKNWLVKMAVQAKIFGDLKGQEERLSFSKFLFDKYENGIREIIQVRELLIDNQKSFAEYNIRFRCIESISHNGVLVWKIHDYRRRKSDAKDGRVLSLYSHPFYTSPCGYKMCGRVYLNGDGEGKEKYMSFYFVMLKGDYDALLPWPFQQSITLSLMDLSGKGKDLSDTFKPDSKSNSYRRPENDMNIAVGCPKFVRHSTVETPKYLKNDTIILRIKIDTNNLKAPDS